MAKKKKKPYNLKSTIISSLREIHRNYDANRKACKNSCKVAPATFACEKCNVWIYEGKSEQNYLKLVAENLDKDIIMKNRYKLQIDHIDPIIKLETWSWNWDDYINRLFCDINNLQGLCKPCHAAKTKIETSKRAELRKKK